MCTSAVQWKMRRCAIAEVGCWNSWWIPWSSAFFLHEFFKNSWVGSCCWQKQIFFEVWLKYTFQSCNCVFKKRIINGTILSKLYELFNGCHRSFLPHFRCKTLVPRQAKLNHNWITEVGTEQFLAQFDMKVTFGPSR